MTTDFSRLERLSESTLLYFGQKQNTKKRKLMTVSTRQKRIVLEELNSSVLSLMWLGMEALLEGRKQEGTDVSLASCAMEPWHLLISMRS